MNSDPRADPRRETSKEVGEARLLSGDVPALRKYWNNLYHGQYLDVLEAKAEFGRHGVIAEIITRTIDSGRVIDAGCGTGILASLLDPKRFYYLGLDISDTAIEFARRNRSRQGAEFRTERIEDCHDIKGAKAVVFNEVLYYIGLTEGLSIAKLWLDEGGVIVVSLFDFPEGREVLAGVQGHLDVRWTVTVENLARDLKWHVLAGHFR